jgi:hypothetical protein
MKTSELKGAALDWAVAKCEGLEVYIDDGMVRLVGQPFDRKYAFWTPSTDWAHGGEIIEREMISVSREFTSSAVEWAAWTPAPIRDDAEAFGYGDSPLIAAMRCYVASKLGDEVEIPEELNQ